MNLQAKLTLGAVALETLIVSVISAVDLGNVMQIELHAAERRAALVRDVAAEYVSDVLNRAPQPPLRVALRDPLLHDRLITLMSQSDELIEIEVVDPLGQILADNYAERIGLTSPHYLQFDDLVNHSSWLEKWNLLSGRQKH